MDVIRLAERSMSMDDTQWMRHATPLGAWTRFICLPLLAIAVWGGIWLTPRAIPPLSTANRVAQGAFVSRAVLDRRSVPIPAHRRDWALLLAFLPAPRRPPLVRSLRHLDMTMTVLGILRATLPRIWFADRMIRFHDGMKGADPSHESRRRPQTRSSVAPPMHPA